MPNNQCLSLSNRLKDNKISYSVVFNLLLFTLLMTNSAHANFESTENSNTGMCPANHKMYYIGATPPVSSTTFPVVSQPLNWTAGNATSTFTFNEPSGSKTFNINFSSILDRNNSQGTPPFYGSINGSTASALNLVHDSTSNVTNHVLNISINRSISKSGYKIQDLDSLTSRVLTGYTWWGAAIYEDRTPYIEQVDVSTNNGRLTFNSIFHNANNPAPNTSIVSGIQGRNCSNGECNIDASWGYKAANSVLNLKHNNILNQTSGAHAVGYSDFYFCLAPPKLIVKKALNGTRLKNTDANRDQFEISVTGGSVAANSFTTTGTGSSITNGSSATLSLAEGTNYTITEKLLNGTTLGDIANYSASYTCTNATTGSTTIMPTTAMTYNATAKTRSFTLTNTTYGDEITCTITNTPRPYTFSGTVFNDNGGITGNKANATNANITNGPYANNTNYFNGVFNPPQETGITGSTVKLVNCTAPNTVYATQVVSATGTYQINVPATAINSNLNSICLVEERSGNDYPIRTDNASKAIKIIATTYDYPNNNFGRVIAENAALVLTKYQYINNCPTTLNYNAISETTTPNTGFSTANIEDIEPGKCIAYKITATNRANTQIDNFVMADVLQKEGVANAALTSVLANPALATADYDNSSPAIGQNGTIKTKSLVLSPRTKRDFYFNTKYGTTLNAQ